MSKKRAVVKTELQQDTEYAKMIRKLEKEIKRLRSENSSLQDALRTTDEYLMAISQDKTIENVFQEIQEKTNVKAKESCPNCKSSNMRKISLGVVRIIACSNCSYRNRINDSQS